VRLADPAGEIGRHHVGLAVIGEVGVLLFEQRPLAWSRGSGAWGRARLGGAPLPGCVLSSVLVGANSRDLLSKASRRGLVVEEADVRQLDLRGLVVEAMTALGARPRPSRRGLTEGLPLPLREVHFDERVELRRARRSLRSGVVGRGDG